MAFSAFSPLQSLISDFSHSYGLDIRMLEYHLQQDWLEIVGPSLAAHTRVDSIKFRKLWIAVENSVWLQQLVFLKPAVFEKIKARPHGPLITDIGFRIGEVHPLPESVPVTIKMPDPPPDIVAFAKELTASIKDSNLRACLTQTITKALSSS